MDSHLRDTENEERAERISGAFNEKSAGCQLADPGRWFLVGESVSLGTARPLKSVYPGDLRLRDSTIRGRFCLNSGAKGGPGWWTDRLWAKWIAGMDGKVSRATLKENFSRALIGQRFKWLRYRIEPLEVIYCVYCTISLFCFAQSPLPDRLSAKKSSNLSPNLAFLHLFIRAFL